jgi:hypothetical protein
MSLSKEEQMLRELRWINTQLNPGPAALKALGFLVLVGVVFTTAALIVNGAARLHTANRVPQQQRRLVRGGTVRPPRVVHPQVVNKGETI